MASKPFLLRWPRKTQAYPCAKCSLVQLLATDKLPCAEKVAELVPAAPRPSRPGFMEFRAGHTAFAGSFLAAFALNFNCMVSKIKDSTVPAHLRPEGLAFLRALARRNDREWFQPRKAVFDAELKEPMLAIIRRVSAAMESFAPDYVRPAEKCLFRIYRDTRFSNNKLPYKTHVAAWWSHEGLEKTSGAGYYFHIDAKEVVVAAGAWMPEKDQLAAIRHWLLGHHLEFRKRLQKAAIRKTFSEFEGNALTRSPKGFPAEHPALDLIRCRQWGLSTTLPASAALDPGFAATLVHHFRLAAPLVGALNEPILAASAPRKKVLFGLN
jgi:uncharacterized protein (TIGR02453 family)